MSKNGSKLSPSKTPQLPVVQLASELDPVPGYRALTAPEIEIDWDYFMSRRRAILDHTDTPPYLLLPEVNQLLKAIDHPLHHFLFNTLWHTGARISEALQLRPEDFKLEERYPYISIPRSKQRGRPKKNKPRKPRMVDILDEEYLQEVRRTLEIHKGGRSKPIFQITRQTALRWLEGYVRVQGQRSVKWSIPIGLHTFRHSFAINAVLHWTPLPALQAWLGHSRRDSTEIYTQVLMGETAHLMARIKYREYK